MMAAESLSRDDRIAHLNPLREARATRLSPTDDLDTQPRSDPDTRAQRTELNAAGMAERALGVPHVGDLPAPRPPARHVRLGVLAALVGLAVLAIAALALDPLAAHPSGAVTRPQPTATSTATATPTSATMPGFKLFSDPSAGFAIQYPENWQVSQNDLGVNFYDNDTLTTYQLQIDQPADPYQCVQPDVASASACWVDYVFSQEQPRYGDQFQRMNGPIPPVTIGGQVWQSGLAVLGVQESPDMRIRYQVYATIWSGKPYIIGLFTPDHLFAQGNQRYFEPMLSSFLFLPNAS
jgi:hypothetical protein